MRTMNIFHRMLFYIPLIVLGVGCTSKGRIENYADFIQIIYRTGPTISSKDDLLVDIRNTSSYCFDFPPDFGIKITTQIGGSTREVKNLMDYVGDKDIFLKPKGDVFDTEVADFMPDLSSLSLNNPTAFEGLINGHLCDNPNIPITIKVPFTVTP